MHRNTALTRTDNTTAAGLPGDASIWRRRDNQSLQLQRPGERESQQAEGLTDVSARFLRLRVADGDASPATIRTYHS
ncbi:MAG: hypothetical protein JXM73_21365 [Anaerolineae bacterium]|nr:hypothetical protein [Anaerolineae bacterium]